MLPPQELKNKTFSRTAKGYDITEVDEYMNFIIEKYSEIFAQCAKYDKKLRVVSSRISEIQQEEELIRRLSVSTQKNCDRLTAEAEEEAKNIILKARETSEHILGEAKEKAQTALALIEQKAVMQIESTQKKSDALLLSTRTRCTKLLGDFKKEISTQTENITKIKNISEEFNSKLLSMYKNHLNLLTENTSIPNVDLEKFNDSGLYDAVMREIKNDAVEIAKRNTGVEYDFDNELESLRATKAAVSDLEAELQTPAKPLEKEDAYIEPEEEYEEDEEEDDDDDEDEEEDEEEAEEGLEEDEEDDVKIFNRNDSRNDKNRGVDEDEFTEKPLATYDSDDFGYEDDSTGSQDEAYESYGDSGDEYETDESGGNDNDDEDIQTTAKSKGFFGLFKKKRSKGTKKYEEEIDDDDSDSMDIFEDLDDDE